MATSEEWKAIGESARQLLMMTDTERIKHMKKVMVCAKDLREQTILALFYIYGMRPEELLSMTKADFSIRENDVMVHLPTAKEGSPRTIVLDKNDTPFMDIILRYLNTIPIVDWLIFREFRHHTNFNKALSRIERKYKELYGTEICLSPYVFRKFRISNLYYIGARAADILAWKGGKSIQAVEKSYTYLKPVTMFKKEIR